jgi:predicted SnoaL-like aldol condensation-catalyzing enzyme
MKTTPSQNKALVFEAFDMLFNKRDCEAATHFLSVTYIQHSAHIEPGRDGLFNLVRSLPRTLRFRSLEIDRGIPGRHPVRRAASADQT